MPTGGPAASAGNPTIGTNGFSERAAKRIRPPSLAAVPFTTPTSPVSRKGLLRQMPTVLREGGFRVYFFSHEPFEPPHVHVARGSESAKFWLEPVALARNYGFGAHELGRIETLVTDNRGSLLEAWHEFHSE